MITVEEFMTAEPYTLSENNSLDDARRVMTEKHIRHIPVTGDDKKLLGLVTQRDVLAATDPESKQLGDTTTRLADVMIRDVSVVSTTDSLRHAAMYIQSHKYGCLPVVTDGRLIGIITDSDFIDIAINLLEQVEVMEQEIATGLEDTVDDVDMLEYEETQ